MFADDSPSALPYCGAPPLPAEIWSRWNGDPLLIALLAALLALPRDRHGGRRSGASFTIGWLIVVVLSVSPLCALTSALFSARAAHHALLIAAAAPLLVAGGLRLPRLARDGAAIPLAAAIQAATLWIWHLPAPYAAALSHDGVYLAMQVTLLASALLFWSSLRQPSAPAGTVLLALLATTLQMGLLGALITFASTPLYAPHLQTTAAWGLSALEDQQLGGLIMWVPASLPALGAALLVIVRRLAGERAGRAEARP